MLQVKVQPLFTQSAVAWLTVVVHPFPHVLQLLELEAVLTHVEPQSVSPVEHPEAHE